MSTAINPSMVPVRAQLLASAAILVALALPAAAALLVDERLIHGVSVWDKPLKFGASLSLHLLTLWFLVGELGDPLPPRARRTIAVSAVVGATCALLEALYITLQAARGRASHFNQQSGLESFLYFGVMGPAALLILASTFAIGWALWRHGRRDTAPGLRAGGCLGLMLGTVLTLVTVIPLSAGFVDGMGHWVGGVRSDADGLPITGWSTQGGDLRVPHFFATHLMQALPFTGWLADRLAPQRAVAWVGLSAFAGSVVVALTLWQAVAGQPLISR